MRRARTSNRWCVGSGRGRPMAAATGRCACAWPRGFGQKVSAKSVLGVMRRMGLRCRIRAANPWRRYNSYGGARRAGACTTCSNATSMPAGRSPSSAPMSRSPGSPGQGVPRARVRHGRQGDRRLGRAPTPRHGPAEAPARHARGTPARARSRYHTRTWDGQYRHRWWRKELERLNIRQSMSRKGNSEGRVLPQRGIRFIRLVQARAGRVHHVLEHQTTPRKTRGTHPGGVPEHVPRVLGMYPEINNVQQTRRSSSTPQRKHGKPETRRVGFPGASAPRETPTGMVAAACYSPTPCRVQYHHRARP